MNTTLPLYARFVAVVGRPLVLIAALAMSAPGEYHLAVMAGWSTDIAWIMPLTLTAYAAVAAVMSATCPDSRSAKIGAVAALALALSAQMTAHLIMAGHMSAGPWLVAAVSAVPPVVAGHVMHMAGLARPAQTAPVTAPGDSVPEPVTVSADAPADSSADMTAEADTGADTGEDVAAPADIVPPTADMVKAAIDVLSAGGREVTGKAMADHFGVSERTGRRYLTKVAA